MSISTLRKVGIPFSIALCLTVILASVPVLAQQENSSRAEFPGRRIGGGTRGECITGRQPLVTLNPVNNLGVTASDRPSIYFLMPALEEARQAEFILRDSQEKPIYETVVDINQTEKIVRVQLPENYLTANQDYHWYFSLVCDPQDRSQNVVLSGWLRQVSPAIASENESGLAASLEQVRAYQEAGLWLDAIATLVNLRQTYPHDDQVLDQWTQLLQALELDTVIDQSIAVQR